MLGGLQWLLKHTRVGLSIRAVANNPMGAAYVGINTERTIIATFVIGSTLGAIAGLIVGLYQGAIFPAMGFAPGVQGVRCDGHGRTFVDRRRCGLRADPGEWRRR